MRLDSALDLVVSLFRVHSWEGGHSWPSAGRRAPGIPWGSELIWQFLARHARADIIECPANSVPVVSEELCTASGGRCPIVLDVRTASEWADGHASCATRLPLQDDASLNATALALAGGDLGAPIVTYCGSGFRAGQAEAVLGATGFTSVTNGGGWSQPAGHDAAIESLCECSRPCSAKTTAEIVYGRRSNTPTTLPFDPAVVSTPGGVVRGVLSPETGTREFFGIPYGKSPHGDRRFMPPEAADRWSGVKDATKQRDGCLRAGWRGASGTEDCLYVNVHAPLPTQPCHPEGGLPVM